MKYVALNLDLTVESFDGEINGNGKLVRHRLRDLTSD